MSILTGLAIILLAASLAFGVHLSALATLLLVAMVLRWLLLKEEG